MFEVGFTELLLIFALALIVLGPEKLPRVASQVGRWIGRARAMARQFREQLEEETILDETIRPPATPQPSSQPQPSSPPPEKYYQPDDDTGRADVSHADAGAEPPVDDPSTAPPSPPSPPTADHERGT
ncbi:MAG: Sec-independent protein translocase protein TatB [Steroidobacteraceae bacterium]|nr:Sec-independent protein translocase protein TatB [Steroidobacteraceae bacterium]